MLQTLGRAYRSADAGNYLPSLLKSAMAEPSAKEAAKYARPFSLEAHTVLSQLQPSVELPPHPKAISGIIENQTTLEWAALTHLKLRHKKLKPSVDQPLYLVSEPKPLVTIRARLRFGVALVPARRHVYDRRISAQCPHCVDMYGDVKHVLLQCPRFGYHRSRLCKALQTQLRVKVALSLNLLLGLPPPEAVNFAPTLAMDLHLECLRLTGEFITYIDRVMKL